MITFTIPLSPITKKNNQRIFINKATGKPFIAQSKQYIEYENKALWLIPAKAKRHIDYPVNVKATYYVAKENRVDISNLHSALHDVLVKAGVLKDDSSVKPCIVFSTDGSRVFVDKSNPRTEVEITEVEI